MCQRGQHHGCNEMELLFWHQRVKFCLEIKTLAFGCLSLGSEGSFLGRCKGRAALLLGSTRRPCGVQVPTVVRDLDRVLLMEAA